MKEYDLEFLDTMSIEDFKDSMKTDHIDIIKNPKTNKLFFTWSRKKEDRGPVTHKHNGKAGSLINPVISKCYDPKKKKELFLLHEEADLESNLIESY